ncbi:MAG: hypothetical protein ACU0A5_24095, partial [Salipiger marinus]|uniref:hypothetical protein n=1 Tax=Salipiger marinus TaxID=555512 RepID=UPI00405883D7
MRTDADAGSRGTRFVGSDVAPYAEGDLALIGPNLPLAERALRLTGILLDLSQQTDRRVLSATALAPEGLPRDQRRMEAV